MLHTNAQGALLLRLPEVKAASGLSRSTLYERIADGLWPRPVSLGGRAVAWPIEEVHAINRARIAGRADAQIRALVKQLHAARVFEVRA